MNLEINILSRSWSL